MSGLSPFEVSRGIANNISGAFRSNRDENIIEQILQQAEAAKRQEDIDGLLAQVIQRVSPERQQAPLSLLGNKQSRLAEKQKEIIAKEAAVNAGYTYGAPPAVQTQQVKDRAKAEALSQYGLGGIGQPTQGQSIQQSGTQLPTNQMGQNQASQSPFESMSDEQLTIASGSPYKEISEPAKQTLNRRIEARKAKKPGDEFANIREKSVSEYVNNALSNREEAENMKFTIDTARKAIKGDIQGPGYTAIIKNNPYGQLIVGLTPDEASLQASNKKLLEGSKGIFGSKPTEREIFLLLNSMLPSIGKTQEANLAGLDFIEKINEIKLIHSEIIDQLTDGGTKYIPDLERQVAEKMKPFGTALRNELVSAVDKYSNSNDAKDSKNGKLKFRAPDGSAWEMTQKQVDDAKAKGVIFEPIK